MNKKLLLALTSSAFVLLLSACGDSSTEEVDSELRKDTESEQVEAEQKKEEVTEEKEEEATTDTEEVNEVVADDDLVKIELISVERTKDELFGDSINVNFEIENKTDNKIIVQSRDVSADGYMVDDIAVLSSEIASGKKTKDKMTLEEVFLDEGEELPELNENLEMTLIVIDDETFDELATYDVNIDF